MSKHVMIGSVVEITKAYNSETGARDIVDEVAHCVGSVVGIDGRHARVEMNDGREVHIVVSRLRAL